MAFLGSVPAYSIRLLPATTNIPASSGTEVALTTNSTSDVMSMEFINATAKDVNVYVGPTTALTLLLCVGSLTSGIVKSDRQPIALPKGTRISLRAADNTAISTGGAFIINAWV